MNNKKLEKFILEHTIPDYGMKLLKLKDAIKFVRLCEGEKNVKLGGFDGFYLHPDGVQIEQLLSPDYSKNSKEEAINLALDFFSKQKEENVGFEFVYVEK